MEKNISFNSQKKNPGWSDSNWFCIISGASYLLQVKSLSVICVCSLQDVFTELTAQLLACQFWSGVSGVKTLKILVILIVHVKWLFFLDGRSGGSLHSTAIEHSHHSKLLIGAGCQSALYQATSSQILLCCCAAALRLAGNHQDLQCSKRISFLIEYRRVRLFLTLFVCFQCFSRSLPMCLKKAMVDKFKDFSEYQLAKYNTRKQRCKHNRNRRKAEVQ